MPRPWLKILSCVVLAWTAVSAADEFEQLPAYKVGQSRTPLTAIEGKLVAALEAPNATFDARQFICRVLRQIGTDRSVPALAKWLTDPTTSHMARHALERMAGEKASAALRDALGKTTGALRIGMIGSVGVRKDAKAAGLLADLLTDKDAATVEAALKALGRIATPEALGALYRADVPSPRPWRPSRRIRFSAWPTRC
ncbi:MAG: HEAT repeat domain-containing protein [Planctomycetota bacterium]|nr:HEAT repeat domain-containing protein [Planctomycetota bacterium]